VVSLDVRNRLANDVMVVPLSTTLRPAPTHVRIEVGEGGLHHASMAKCEQLTTLDKAFLLRGPFAGAIQEETMREVERAIMRAVGIVV
jgi:mRNA-degrading endonuclease toxin of MazEF toxin-antitoxin module